MIIHAARSKPRLIMPQNVTAPDTQNELVSLRTQNTAHLETISRLKDELANSTETATSKDKSIANLQEQLRLAKEVAQAQSAKNVADAAKIEGLKHQVVTLSKTIKAHDSKIKALQAENEHLRSDDAALSPDASALFDQLNKEISEIANLDVQKAASEKPKVVRRLPMTEPAAPAAGAALCIIEGTVNKSLVISRNAYAGKKLEDLKIVAAKIGKEIAGKQFATVNVAILEESDITNATLLLTRKPLSEKLKEKKKFFWHRKGHLHLFNRKDLHAPFKGKQRVQQIDGSSPACIQKYLPKTK